MLLDPSNGTLQDIKDVVINLYKINASYYANSFPTLTEDFASQLAEKEDLFNKTVSEMKIIFKSYNCMKESFQGLQYEVIDFPLDVRQMLFYQSHINFIVFKDDVSDERSVLLLVFPDKYNNQSIYVGRNKLAIDFFKKNDVYVKPILNISWPFQGNYYCQLNF